MKKRFKSVLVFLVFSSAFIFMFTNPDCITYHSLSALKMCASTVIPSLFIFIVFSEIIAGITQGTYCTKGILSQIARFLKLDVRLVIQCAFGILAGAGAASVGIAKIYKSGTVSKRQAENAIILLSGCSAPFIMTVCSVFLESAKLGFLLLLSNFLAVFTSFFILCDRHENFTLSQYSISEKKASVFSIFSSSLSNSVINTLNMCSYIIFFSVISGAISDTLISLSVIHNESAAAFIYGFFEMTGGIVRSVSLSGNERIMFICAVVGFSGISIIFQLSHILGEHNLSIRQYIYSRLLCTLLCPIYMLVFMLTLPYSVTCFSQGSAVFSGFEFDLQNLLSCVVICISITITVAVFVIINKKHKKNEQN